ncbi:hypothetical protein DM860_010049 [Cuscuta australis]|uniref:Protein MIZU-KUSSEI 1 n=1 Tax=Cuscuta australis TaxID=267555 RepID=A0A328D6A1_9ASTE|nr:hypothetical protein DM860_010049 [Cuscuta australis]
MANNTVPDLCFKKHYLSSSSSSKVINNEEDEDEQEHQEEEEVKVVKPIVSNAEEDHDPKRSRRKRLQSPVGVSRLMRSVLAILARNRRINMFSHPRQDGCRLGTRVVVGTLFGSRHGHVHLSFQKDPASPPVFLVELATPTSGLVREMASGLVRVALECDKDEAGPAGPLLDRPGPWRTYCNGRKCGFAARRDAGEKEWEVLKAVGPISMGAGVLPPSGNGDDGGGSGGGGGGEVMYMRAKFERVVGSRDSEAFYMVNPDNNAAPELSIYLLRV